MKYTEAILSNSTQKLLWFEITKMLIAVRKKFYCVIYYNFRHTFVACCRESSHADPVQRHAYHQAVCVPVCQLIHFALLHCFLPRRKISTFQHFFYVLAIHPVYELL